MGEKSNLLKNCVGEVEAIVASSTHACKANFITNNELDELIEAFLRDEVLQRCQQSKNILMILAFARTVWSVDEASDVFRPEIEELCESDLSIGIRDEEILMCFRVGFSHMTNRDTNFFTSFVFRKDRPIHARIRLADLIAEVEFANFFDSLWWKRLLCGLEVNRNVF